MFNRTEAILADFRESNGTEWMCSAANQSALLGGKRVAHEYHIVRADVLGCGSVYTSKTNCANATQLAAFLQARGIFFLTLYMISEVVNPDQAEPVTHAITDKYIIFDDHFGHFMYSQVAEYQMTTDESLLPTADNVQRSGSFLTDD